MDVMNMLRKSIVDRKGLHTNSIDGIDSLEYKTGFYNISIAEVVALDNIALRPVFVYDYKNEDYIKEIRFVIVKDGEDLGAVTLSLKKEFFWLNDAETNLGYGIKEEYQGKGYMSEALTYLKPIIRYFNLVSLVKIDNLASVKLLDKLYGYRGSKIMVEDDYELLDCYEYSWC